MTSLSERIISEVYRFLPRHAFIDELNTKCSQTCYRCGIAFHIDTGHYICTNTEEIKAAETGCVIFYKFFGKPGVDVFFCASCVNKCKPMRAWVIQNADTDWFTTYPVVLSFTEQSVKRGKQRCAKPYTMAELVTFLRDARHWPANVIKLLNTPELRLFYELHQLISVLRRTRAKPAGSEEKRALLEICLRMRTMCSTLEDFKHLEFVQTFEACVRNRFDFSTWPTMSV